MRLLACRGNFTSVLFAWFIFFRLHLFILALFPLLHNGRNMHWHSDFVGCAARCCFGPSTFLFKIFFSLMILVQLLLPFSSTTLISTIFKLYTRFSMQKVRHAPDFLGCSSGWSAFPALVSFFFFSPSLFTLFCLALTVLCLARGWRTPQHSSPTWRLALEVCCTVTDCSPLGKRETPVHRCLAEA